MSTASVAGTGDEESARLLEKIKQGLPVLKAEVDGIARDDPESRDKNKFFDQVNRLFRLMREYTGTIGLDYNAKVPFNLEVRDNLEAVWRHVNDKQYKEADEKIDRAMKTLGMPVDGGKRRTTRRRKRRSTRKSRK